MPTTMTTPSIPIQKRVVISFIFNLYYPVGPAFAYRLLVPEATFEGLPPMEVQVLCQSEFSRQAWVSL
jgi:hypothetical protein